MITPTNGEKKKKIGQFTEGKNLIIWPTKILSGTSDKIWSYYGGDFL